MLKAALRYSGKQCLSPSPAQRWPLRGAQERRADRAVGASAAQPEPPAHVDCGASGARAAAGQANQRGPSPAGPSRRRARGAPAAARCGPPGQTGRTAGRAAVCRRRSSRSRSALLSAETQELSFSWPGGGGDGPFPGRLRACGALSVFRLHCAIGASPWMRRSGLATGCSRVRRVGGGGEGTG